jgi:hypothetical protein
LRFKTANLIIECKAFNGPTTIAGMFAEASHTLKITMYLVSFDTSCEVPFADHVRQWRAVTQLNKLSVTCCWIFIVSIKQVPTPIACFQIFKEQFAEPRAPSGTLSAQKTPH